MWGKCSFLHMGARKKCKICSLVDRLCFSQLFSARKPSHVHVCTFLKTKRFTSWSVEAYQWRESHLYLKTTSDNFILLHVPVPAQKETRVFQSRWLCRPPPQNITKLRAARPRLNKSPGFFSFFFNLCLLPLFLVTKTQVFCGKNCHWQMCILVVIFLSTTVISFVPVHLTVHNCGSALCFRRWSGKSKIFKPQRHWALVTFQSCKTGVFPQNDLKNFLWTFDLLRLETKSLYRPLFFATKCSTVKYRQLYTSNLSYCE